VRRNNHIHVEFIYQFLPNRLAFALSTLVDLVRVALFAFATWLGWKVTSLMGFQNMVVIEVSLSWVYGACTFGCALMTARAAQVAVRHWRQGWSGLMRPEAPLAS
jgi:TRAP-type C4-dicarboxylate transport system permease small subunit